MYVLFIIIIEYIELQEDTETHQQLTKRYVERYTSVNKRYKPSIHGIGSRDKKAATTCAFKNALLYLRTFPNAQHQPRDFKP